MRKGIVTLLGLAMLPALALAQAQKPENNWENLNSVQMGQKIQIVDVDLKRHDGTFLAYAPDAVSIRTRSGDRGFSRESVVRVSNREKSRRLRNALIGAAIGAGAGLAIGALADRAFTETGERDKMKKFLTPVAAGAGRESAPAWQATKPSTARPSAPSRSSLGGCNRSPPPGKSSTQRIAAAH